MQRRAALRKRADVADWLYIPSWRQSPPPILDGGPAASWLLFLDRPGLGAVLAGRLREMGHAVTTVTPGEAFVRLAEDAWAVCPRERSDYEALLDELEEAGRRPDRVAHLWCVGEGPEGGPAEELGLHRPLRRTAPPA